MAELVPIPSPGIPLVFGEAGAPIVAILHDMYGRLPWLEPYAEALANRGGFRVVVPDFYDGVATTESGDARTLMRDLTDARAAGIL
ncbi:MAG: dienelactone hydrolase, partial [Leifsonia sp.]